MHFLEGPNRPKFCGGRTKTDFKDRGWLWRAGCISHDSYLLYVYLHCIYKLSLPTCPWYDINKSLVKDTTYYNLLTWYESYKLANVSHIDCWLPGLAHKKPRSASLLKRVKFFPCGCKSRRLELFAGFKTSKSSLSLLQSNANHHHTKFDSNSPGVG